MGKRFMKHISSFEGGCGWWAVIFALRPDVGIVGSPRWDAEMIGQSRGAPAPWGCLGPGARVALFLSIC